MGLGGASSNGGATDSCGVEVTFSAQGCCGENAYAGALEAQDHALCDAARAPHSKPKARSRFLCKDPAACTSGFSRCDMT